MIPRKQPEQASAALWIALEKKRGRLNFCRHCRCLGRADRHADRVPRHKACVDLRHELLCRGCFCDQRDFPQ